MRPWRWHLSRWQWIQTNWLPRLRRMPIARDAFLIMDDRPLLPGDPVVQRRFTHIRSPNNRHLQRKAIEVFFFDLIAVFIDNQSAFNLA